MCAVRQSTSPMQTAPCTDDNPRGTTHRESIPCDENHVGVQVCWGSLLLSTPTPHPRLRPHPRPCSRPFSRPTSHAHASQSKFVVRKLLATVLRLESLVYMPVLSETTGIYLFIHSQVTKVFDSAVEGTLFVGGMDSNFTLSSGSK